MLPQSDGTTWAICGTTKTRMPFLKRCAGRRGPDAPAAKNNALACYEFVHGMQVGDFVIAKVGRAKLLGVGRVDSDYYYDPRRAEYHHVRRVKWLRAANIELPEKFLLGTKDPHRCYRSEFHRVRD